MANIAAVEAREATHWDVVARKLDEDRLTTPPCVGALEKKRLALMGDLQGRHVLDVGCGSGDWAGRLAAAGATVEAIDISPLMVEATRRRSSLLGFSGRIHASVMSATRLEYPDATFDVVHGQDVVHHLDPDEFGREIARVLKPGGVAVFRENSSANPLLMFCRSRLCGRFGISKWSSDDEYPLTTKGLRTFSRHFVRVDVEYPEFLMFHYVDAKLLLYKSKALSNVLRVLDRILGGIPGLRRFSYRQMIAAQR